LKPARCMNISADMCGDWPVPVEPMLILSGLALA
jgi:hypothetical protein